MNDELTPPLPLPREGWFVVGPMTGGCALLAPVCNLSPLFPVALPRAHLQGLKAQEFKDNKDFNDIKDAPCQLRMMNDE